MHPLKHFSALLAATSGVVGTLRAARAEGAPWAALCIVTHHPGSYYQNIARQWGLEVDDICQLATVGR
ncbi:hypothetical protein LVJ94_41390 [Pendulispora rubella]|uniref:Uncharacterized protein n=1 Tax=Pendulispora rubella TaxID=2741070 RepID=A0ABZ2L0J8_9BACT